MESHVLNMYHQAAYRNIGHKITRSTSESLSSESSCNQNSPEYSQSQRTNQYEEVTVEGVYWDSRESHRVWSHNQNVNITQTNQDTCMDDSENMEVHEMSVDDRNSEGNDHIDEIDSENVEETSLVEGDDYDIIQVFAVDPDLDLEASSDEEQEVYCINEEEEEEEESGGEPENEAHHSQHRPENLTNNICQDSLGINFDALVVSNVDEYFIKNTNEKHILEVKDGLVVKDVDEYFIKDSKDDLKTNVDLLFKKDNIPADTDFRISKTLPEQIFAPDTSVDKDEEVDEEAEDPVADVSINESDLDVLPNIEDLKRYLLEDMPYTKLKNAKSSSVSLPHSPMHLCTDMPDAKTCLSFEDLNLDLSELTFENDKEISATSIKSDNIPHTLTEEDINSFLITDTTELKTTFKEEDDLSTQDMDIDHHVDSIIDNVNSSNILLDRKCTSTPIPCANVLQFCIEKTSVKKEPDIKLELDDYVDVESCNDAVIPVLEANNLNSLLEQFEATEKLNNKTRKPSANVNEGKAKSFSLTSGMRLQDAGVQLNKNKMRQILMPSTVNTVIRRSPSPVRSDHDYCAPKKRRSLPNLKRGQSLLKPEVLSSNNRILNSRHRSCKNKKIVYHLSSDDESDVISVKKNKLTTKRASDKSDNKINKKSSAKLSAKPSVNSNHRKKISPARTSNNINKRNGSVMVKNACKASDTPCSQNSNGSIKLTIKNKSEVIIKNCDVRGNHKDIVIAKPKSSAYSTNKLANNIKIVETVDRNINEDTANINKHVNINTRHKGNSKPEDFYTALFNNKQDVQIPQSTIIKEEHKCNKSEVKTVADVSVNKIEQPQRKRKLNLHEYKMRRGVNSNNNSAQVSPESIFPDLSCNLNLDKNFKVVVQSQSNNSVLVPEEQQKSLAPKVIFDPIREASRKILMNSRKHKAEATRKRDEDIVMSKIPKVENLELQPLISDAEMMKIVGMTPQVLPVPIVTPRAVVREGKQPHKDYDEIVLVSIGTNTDENIFTKMNKLSETKKRKSQSPPTDNKATINFKIKKSEHVSMHNVFDAVKRKTIDDKNRSDIKIGMERLNDIKATLRSVGKQVDTKMSSNSLFASIQDIVMKKTPAVNANSSNGQSKLDYLIREIQRREAVKYTKPTIIRDYDVNSEHGEDKIILHLEKNRPKPKFSTVDIQTDATSMFRHLEKIPERVVTKVISPLPRKRNDSDMSMSSEGSPVRAKKVQNVLPAKSDDKAVKARPEYKRPLDRSLSKEKRSRSRDRHDVKYRRSRSHSRGHRRKRTPSRTRSRSRGRYKLYRRSDSPFMTIRTRSPYRSRRSPSVRRDYRVNRSRSRSKHAEQKLRSPVPKKKLSPPTYSVNNVKKPAISSTPLLRKPTISESSESSSTSSSSSSSSSSTASSTKSRISCSPYRKGEAFLTRRKVYRSSYSSEDRESNTPVEERRIVFVGRLEKDMNKNALRAQFVKFGPVTEVRLHSKEDGTRYGFVTFQRPRDAWSAVEAANTFPHYDVGFGGRRAFCRQSYADLDGLEAKYTESAYHGQPTLPVRRNNDMSFEQMLVDIKKKLNKRKGDKDRDDTA